MFDNAADCGSRAATTGAVAAGLTIAIAGANPKTGLMYGVRLGAVNFMTDLGICTFAPSMNSSESSGYSSLEYLVKVGGGVAVYGISHSFAPELFPYIKGSAMKTALVNATSIYIGGIAGDRLRNKFYSVLGMGGQSA